MPSVNISTIEGILDVYTLEEILEFNDLSLQDALLFLVEEEFLELPDIRPLEFEWNTINVWLNVKLTDLRNAMTLSAKRALLSIAETGKCWKMKLNIFISI